MADDSANMDTYMHENNFLNNDIDKGNSQGTSLTNQSISCTVLDACANLEQCPLQDKSSMVSEFASMLVLWLENKTHSRKLKRFKS